MMKKLFASILTLTLALSIFTFAGTAYAFAAEETEAVAITADDALQIALDAANFKATSIQYPKVWDDTNDGTAIYKVVFYVGPVGFAYQIDKASGEVLASEIND